MDTVMALTIFVIIYAGIFGLIIGSFLNVCIYRIPEGKTVVKGHSMCMSCKNTLRAKDLVPVFSWLFLRGKCRYCGAPVSSRYAKIEALTSLIYMMIVGPFIYQILFSQALEVSVWVMGEIVVLLFIAPILIVAMMIQYDRSLVLKGAPIFILVLGLVRHVMLFLQTSNYREVVISVVLGIGIAYCVVLAATFFTAKPHTESRGISIIKGDGFRYYFLPERRVLRMTDALFIAIAFALGFPVIIPASVFYLAARLFIRKDEKFRFLLFFVCAGVLVGYVLALLSVF